MPDSSARQPHAAAPIYSTLTRGFDAGTAHPSPGRRRASGTAEDEGSTDCPIFDQLASRRLARRRSNFIHPA